MHKDKILIKGLHCSVRLGVKKEEQEVKRNCELDFSIYFDLTAAGRSEYLPIDKSSTPEARKKNRRTEIILTPKLDELFKVLESN